MGLSENKSFRYKTGVLSISAYVWYLENSSGGGTSERRTESGRNIMECLRFGSCQCHKYGISKIPPATKSDALELVNKSCKNDMK